MREGFEHTGGVIESIPIVVGRENEGGWRADIELMRGVMTYGETREAAIDAVRALALRVAADCLEHGEEVPGPLAKAFVVMSAWPAIKEKRLLAALLRIGWAMAWQSGSHRRSSVFPVIRSSDPTT